MAVIFLNWIYIGFCAFGLGFAFSKFSEKVLGYRLKSVNTVLMAGIVVSTVYAQIFSLFYRVNIEANIILLMFCVAVCIVWRKQMQEFLRLSLADRSLIGKIIIVVLVMVWAFFTSRGYRVPDMDMYHGQSIRWIEEYGVVKGLGTLNNRFGYNSAFFATSALYSMKFLLGRSLHTVNGFLALLLSVEALNLRKAFVRKRMVLSDYARVGAIYYLTTIWDEVNAPSSDYVVMLTLFFIVIKWLCALEGDKENGTGSIAPYALLCVMGVYALTLKVTAGLILILLVKPAYQLIREKKWREILIYLAMGLITAVPWFVRNVIITGWLLYPFPAIDLFDFDWKMTDMSIIYTDATMIKVYARGARDLGINATVREWFPLWFDTQLSTLEKLFVLADWVLIGWIAAKTVVVLCKKKWEQLDEVLVLVTVCACFLFWQFSAPMMRYGYTHVLLLATLGFGSLWELVRNRYLKVIPYFALILYGCYKLYVGVDYIAGCCLLDAYVWQHSYGDCEVETCELDGITFYYAKYGGYVGYDPFPSAAQDPRGEVELRGDSLKDGFRYVRE